MMIKLIVTDLDGTLLQNGAQSISDETACLIEAIQKKGILFAAASGRQYPNLQRLFGELSKEMAFICENGAYVVYRGRELGAFTMDRELGIEIMRDIYDRENCEILLSGKNTSYLQPKTEAYVYRMRDVVKNNVQIVEDITSVEEDFLKISVYNPNGIENCAAYFHEKWSTKVQDTISGKLWQDFTKKGVNKGNSLMLVQEKLEIGKEQTMVFGDNYNDIEMLSEAEYSYVMKNAHPDIQMYGRFTTDCVENVLKELLRKMGES